MDLAQLDPRIWLAKIVWYIVVALLFLLTGFYGGCQYKQNQWDAEKFRQLEEAKNKEAEDATNGAKTAKEFEQGRQQENQGKDFVRQGIAGGKPFVRIVAPTSAPKIIGETGCPEPVKIETKEGTIQNEENPGVYLTAHFMQLYDVSVAPGNTELRTRTYQETEGTTLDEGFEKVIVPNDEEYAAVRLQLNKLIDRIEQKKELFKQPSKGIF